MESKTQAALRLLKEGKTVKQASAEIGISEQAIRAGRLREQKRQAKETGTCPCCGQKLPE